VALWEEKEKEKEREKTGEGEREGGGWGAEPRRWPWRGRTDGSSPRTRSRCDLDGFPLRFRSSRITHGATTPTWNFTCVVVLICVVYHGFIPFVLLGTGRDMCFINVELLQN
jgi:hypothetical protein